MHLAQRIMAVVVFLGTLTFVGGVTSGTALACDPSNHCYASAQFQPGNEQAFGTTLSSSCLSVADPSASFVTSEQWIYMPNGATLENGMAYGYPKGNTTYWFWAEHLGNTYHEYPSFVPALNHDYASKISWGGGSLWYIWRDGNSIGSSQIAPGPTNASAAGTETTSNAAYVHGRQHNLTYQPVSGTVHSGWPGSLLVNQLPGGNIAWASTSYDFSYARSC